MSSIVTVPAPGIESHTMQGLSQLIGGGEMFDEINPAANASHVFDHLRRHLIGRNVSYISDTVHQLALTDMDAALRGIMPLQESGEDVMIAHMRRRTYRAGVMEELGPFGRSKRLQHSEKSRRQGFRTRGIEIAVDARSATTTEGLRRLGEQMAQLAATVKQTRELLVIGELLKAHYRRDDQQLGGQPGQGRAIMQARRDELAEFGAVHFKPYGLDWIDNRIHARQSVLQKPLDRYVVPKEVLDCNAFRPEKAHYYLAGPRGPATVDRKRGSDGSPGGQPGEPADGYEPFSWLDRNRVSVVQAISVMDGRPFCPLDTMRVIGGYVLLATQDCVAPAADGADPYCGHGPALAMGDFHARSMRRLTYARAVDNLPYWGPDGYLQSYEAKAGNIQALMAKRNGEMGEVLGYDAQLRPLRRVGFIPYGQLPNDAADGWVRQITAAMSRAFAHQGHSGAMAAALTAMDRSWPDLGRDGTLRQIVAALEAYAATINPGGAAFRGAGAALTGDWVSFLGDGAHVCGHSLANQTAPQPAMSAYHAAHSVLRACFPGHPALDPANLPRKVYGPNPTVASAVLGLIRPKRRTVIAVQLRNDAGGAGAPNVAAVGELAAAAGALRNQMAAAAVEEMVRAVPAVGGIVAPTVAEAQALLGTAAQVEAQLGANRRVAGFYAKYVGELPAHLWKLEHTGGAVGGVGGAQALAVRAAFTAEAILANPDHFLPTGGANYQNLVAALDALIGADPSDDLVYGKLMVLAAAETLSREATELARAAVAPAGIINIQDVIPSDLSWPDDLAVRVYRPKFLLLLVPSAEGDPTRFDRGAINAGIIDTTAGAFQVAEPFGAPFGNPGAGDATDAELRDALARHVAQLDAPDARNAAGFVAGGALADAGPFAEVMARRLHDLGMADGGGGLAAGVGAALVMAPLTKQTLLGMVSVGVIPPFDIIAFRPNMVLHTTGVLAAASGAGVQMIGPRVTMFNQMAGEQKLIGHYTEMSCEVVPDEEMVYYQRDVAIRGHAYGAGTRFVRPQGFDQATFSPDSGDMFLAWVPQGEQLPASGRCDLMGRDHKAALAGALPEDEYYTGRAHYSTWPLTVAAYNLEGLYAKFRDERHSALRPGQAEYPLGMDNSLTHQEAYHVYNPDTRKYDIPVVGRWHLGKHIDEEVLEVVAGSGEHYTGARSGAAVNPAGDVTGLAGQEQAGRAARAFSLVG